MQASFRRAAWVAALLLAPPAFGHEPYRVDLVPCTEALCEVMGSAPLHEGRVEVDEDGEVEVELGGGPASALLCVKFQSMAGEVEVVGDLATDALGHADATVGEFEMGVFMGLFRLHEGGCESDGAPLFVTAFAVGAHDDDEDDVEDGYHGEDDNDGDGIPNDEDPDDDNDGIDDVDDVDDDNDGIPDVDDADPDDANPFDDDAVSEAKSAYKAERSALKADYKAEVSDLKDQLKRDVEALREDLEDRLDDL